MISLFTDSENYTFQSDEVVSYTDKINDYGIRQRTLVITGDAWFESLTTECSPYWYESLINHEDDTVACSIRPNVNVSFI